MPAGTFEAGIGYLIEIENRRGAIVTEPTDGLGTDVTVYRGAADTNATFVTGDPAGASVPMPAWSQGLLALLLGFVGSFAMLRSRAAEAGWQRLT